VVLVKEGRVVRMKKKMKKKKKTLRIRPGLKSISICLDKHSILMEKETVVVLLPIKKLVFDVEGIEPKKLCKALREYVMMVDVPCVEEEVFNMIELVTGVELSREGG